MLKSTDRVAVLLHEGIRGTHGKTGLAFSRYRSEAIAVIIDRQCAGESFAELTGIACTAPIVASVKDALAYQPDVLAIGIAPSGGALPEAWWPELKQAVAAGLSIMNGLHTRLSLIPEFAALLHPKQWIWDVRQEAPNLPIASGAARSLACRRVLTVGTDMSVGKMSTSLELDRLATQRGLRSRFLGTGQTGIMIAGDGIALDATRLDFAAGAMEQLVMRYGDQADLLQVEGQGSLLNPASSATLPLLRGTQPTHLILVHRAGQTQIRNCPQVRIPPLPAVVKLYEAVASAGGAFAETKVAAIALNTALLKPEAAQQAIAAVQMETQLPCTDPVRFGADRLLDAILK